MKIGKRILCVGLAVLMLLSVIQMGVIADAVDTSEEKVSFGSKVADDTSLRVDDAFKTSTEYDGRVWTNKAVSADGKFNGTGISSNFSTTVKPDEFAIGLSAMAQGYTESIKTGKKKANIAFVVDLSTSMIKNFMTEDGKTYSRLEILKNVADDFVTTLSELGDDENYEINLSVIVYGGQGYVRQKWISVNNSTLPTLKKTISSFNSLTNDAGNTNAQAGAYMARMIYSDEGAALYNRPANYNDEDTRNFIIFMTDGAPNKYYNKSTNELGSIALSSDKMSTSSTNITRNISSTDYKKMAAYKLLEQAEEFKKVNNSVTFSLGLGEWFVDSGEESGFETGPHLMQLVAACADDLRNPLDAEKITAEYCWEKYLGPDVPDGTMPGANPCFPDLTLSEANFLQTGGKYKVTTDKKTLYFNSMQDMLDSYNSVPGASCDKSNLITVDNGRTEDTLFDTLDECGIPYVDAALLSQVSYYYAGNTASKFKASVKDITQAITNSFSSEITSVSDTGDKDIDGYIKIVDNIGEGMEFRGICGLEYDGILYDEARFAKFVSTCTDDELQTLTVGLLKYFNRNFGTVFNVSTIVQLLHGAYFGGTIYYNSPTDFSSKVPWYAKYNSKTDTYTYVAPYFNSDGTKAKKPDDAAFIVEQHIVSGNIDTVSAVGEETQATYLYIADVINLYTDDETLIFKIPANLLPVRSVIVTDGVAHVLGGVVWPLTLFYKVGLSNNNDEDEMADHLFTDENGDELYRFFSNCWDHSDMHGEVHLGTAYSIFVPHEKNPYYYSKNDILLYIKDSGSYIPADENAEGPFYFEYTYSDSDGTFTEYRAVDDYYKDYGINTIADTSGVLYKHLANGAVKWNTNIEKVRLKTESSVGNATGTEEYYYEPSYSKDLSDNVIIVSKLGNNGEYIFRPQKVTIADTVVLDYGLDVNIDVMANDLFPDEATDIKLDSVVSANDYKINDEQVYFTSPLAEETKSVNTRNGILSINETDNCLKFTTLSSDAKEPFVAYYGCTYVVGQTTFHTFGYVTLVPANNMYYEQDFCNFSDGWVKQGTELSFEQNGNNKYVHGFDPAYESSNYFSNGSAIKTTVTNEMYQQALSDKTYSWPSAEFSFYGTAFDVVSYTGQNTGLMAVTVTNLDTGKAVKNIAVNTHYSSRVGDDNTGSNYGDLYQIPVVVYDLKTYGHYKLTVKASYHPYFDLTKADSSSSETASVNSGEMAYDSNVPSQVTSSNYELSQALSEVFDDNSASIEYYTVTDGKVANVQSVQNEKTKDATQYNTAASSSKSVKAITTSGKYDVYIDAIRTYNPLGTNLSEGIAAETYDSQHELNPTFYKLRDLLIKTDDDDPAFIINNSSHGAMYVEQTVQYVFDNFGNIIESILSGGSSTIKFSTYIKNGPNSEIYLEYGNAVAFRVADYTKNCRVQISAKTPTYKDAILSANGKVVDTIRSGTEMYFDVTDCVSSDGTIVLSNLGRGILSLCNIKLVYEDEITTSALVSDSLTVDAINDVMTEQISQAPVLPDSLSFNVDLVAHNNGKIEKFTRTVSVDSNQFKYYLDKNNEWSVAVDTSAFNETMQKSVANHYSNAQVTYNGPENLHFDAIYSKENGEWLVNSLEMNYNVKDKNQPKPENSGNSGSSSLNFFQLLAKAFADFFKALFPFFR